MDAGYLLAISNMDEKIEKKRKRMKDDCITPKCVECGDSAHTACKMCRTHYCRQHSTFHLYFNSNYGSMSPLCMECLKARKKLAEDGIKYLEMLTEGQLIEFFDGINM